MVENKYIKNVQKPYSEQDVVVSGITGKKFVGVETRLDKKGSKTKILVVKTDEMEEMAKSTRELLKV